MASFWSMGRKVKIKGYSKSKHFQSRQKERSVSDKQVEKVLKKGSASENEEGYLIYRLNEFTVVTDPISECLITVHADGHNIKNAKILSLDVAKEIKAEIKNYKDSFSEAFTNDFYMEMHRERVKILADVNHELEEGEEITIEDYLKKKTG